MFHHFPRLSLLDLSLFTFILCSASVLKVHASTWAELTEDNHRIILKYVLGSESLPEIQGFLGIMSVAKSNTKVYDLAIAASPLSQLAWVSGLTAKTVDNYLWGRLFEERWRLLLRINQERVEHPDITDKEIENLLVPAQKCARSLQALCTRLKLASTPAQFLNTLELLVMGKSFHEVRESYAQYVNDLREKSRNLDHMTEGRLFCFSLLFFETTRETAEHLASASKKTFKKYPRANSWTLNYVLACELWRLKPFYCFLEGCPENKNELVNLNLAGMMRYLKRLSLPLEETVVYHNEFIALATDVTDEDLQYALQPNRAVGNYEQAKNIADRLSTSPSPKNNDLLWKMADAYASHQNYQRVLDIINQLNKNEFIENESLHHEVLYSTTKLALGEIGRASCRERV